MQSVNLNSPINHQSPFIGIAEKTSLASGSLPVETVELDLNEPVQEFDDKTIEALRLALKEAQKSNNFGEIATILKEPSVAKVFEKLGTNKTRAVRDFLLATTAEERLQAFKKIKEGLGNPKSIEALDLTKLGQDLKAIRVRNGHKIDPKARLIIRTLKAAGEHPEYKAMVANNFAEAA